MFKHLFFYRLNTLLKNKSMIFWTLVFPIILGTFFNLAFSNLSKEEKLDTINISVVENVENEKLKEVLNTLSKDDESKMFNIEYVSEDKAKELLNNNEISGYIVIDEKVDVHVKENGINQTIIKYVIDEYYQMSTVAQNAVTYNPQVLYNGALDILQNNNSYFKDSSNKNMDSTVNYFYTLIGMACLYGSFFGLYTINEVEANLSKKGARLNVSPIKKSMFVLTSLLVSIIVQYVGVLILIAYLNLVLKIAFNTELIYILVLSFFGSLAGIGLGILVGVASKKSEQLKMGVLISSTMICSFLAGMMMMSMKYIIEKNIPILAKINPVNMITDGFYSLYCYDNLDRYVENVYSLIIFTAVMFTISYFFLRRKKYDSI